MNGHSPRGLLLLAAVASVAGCDAPAPPPPPVHLSRADPDSNVDAIVRFVETTCLDAAAGAAAFETALNRTGWRAELRSAQDHKENGRQLRSVWRLEHGQLTRDAEGDPQSPWRVVCHLALDAAVAPALARLRSGFDAAARRRGFAPQESGSAEGHWVRASGRRQEQSLSIGDVLGRAAAGRPRARLGVGIMVEIDMVMDPAATGNEHVR